MSQFTGTKCKIKRDGRLKDKIISVEGPLEPICGSNDLAVLATRGNWAAKNAITEEKYTYGDGPFVYGKIGDFGYIVAEKDLEVIL